MDSPGIYSQIEAHYSSLARAGKSSDSDTIAQAFGYSEEDLRSIPSDANLGVSCGNPLAVATLREASLRQNIAAETANPASPQGETVVDFGSGAGFDVFLAAQKVGPRGRAIGVDMNRVSFPIRYCYYLF
jgi:arsenite methyltransferase